MTVAERMGDVASWVFLLGVVVILAATLPPVRAHRAAVLLGGFALALVSFALVLLGWWLQRG